MAIGNGHVPVVTSPISPLSPSIVSRTGLVAEALIHSYDHYGQMGLLADEWRRTACESQVTARPYSSEASTLADTAW